ncbi:HK97 family phage prohead protease [Nonomuraea glycinis]|uniref:HK97 family phage prohead protease n=1 Tax=Nonomuraea glycinis TaxID=2047744 RepID=UPI0033B8CC0F
MPQALQLERKSAGGMSAGIVSAEDEGVVEALVSVTNVVDNVGDLILPGAYAESLAQRTPKGLFSHDETLWVARTEAVEELLPGDPRLLAMAAEAGVTWPREAGALYVKARFNLGTKAGRDTYSNVKFYGRDQEWSIGYQVPRGGSTRDRQGVRRIKKLHLYEYSPVLFGAASQTLTLSVKSALAAEEDLPGLIADCLREGAPLERKRALIRQARESGDLGLLPAGWRDGMDAGAALEDLAERAGREVKADRADAGTGVMVAFLLPPDLAAGLAVEDGLPAEDLHVTLAYLGKELDEQALATVAGIAEEVAAGAGPLSGTVGGLGVFPPNEDGVPVFATVDVPGLEVVRQRLVERLADAGISPASNHGYTPHVTRTYLEEGAGLPEPLPPQQVQFGELAVVRGDEVTFFPFGGAASNDGEAGGDGWDDPLDVGGDGWDDLLDDETAGPEEKGLDVARAAGYDVPLSLEEVRTAIRDHVERWTAGWAPGALVAVEATFDDVAVVCVHQDLTAPSWFQVPYSRASRWVEVGEPVAVSVSATGEGSPDPAGLLASLHDALAAVKRAGIDMETKAGRVLSTANARDIGRAVASLLSVLRRAGIEIADPDKPSVEEPERMPEEPAIWPDSTAPSALPNEMKALPREALAEAAELMAAVYGMAETGGGVS